MKITKEVKLFAEKEFDKKVSEVRDAFYAPYVDREKQIRVEFKPFVDELNRQYNEFLAKYPDAKLRVDTHYSDERFTIGSVSVIRTDFKNDFDKVRFMAELSMGESLSEITTILNKYFN